MEKKKRQRSTNLTVYDKASLTDLIIKYKEVIENKRTDAVSAQMKARAWEELTDEFNSSSTLKRDANQLKHAYENVKQRAKKSASDCKVAQLQTGGGPLVPIPDDTSQKLLTLLGNRATPLVNDFDSDAVYNFETVTEVSVVGDVVSDIEVLSSADRQTYAILVNDDAAAGASSCRPPQPYNISVVVVLVVLLPLTLKNPAQQHAASDVAETNTASAATTSGTATSRQWAHRRRKVPRLQPLQSAVNQEAATKIQQVAEVQHKYYEEKLAMKREKHQLFLQEHAKRMRVLDIQEQLAIKQLKKMEE